MTRLETVLNGTKGFNCTGYSGWDNMSGVDSEDVKGDDHIEITKYE